MPVHSAHFLTYHQVVEIAHLVGMGHQPGEKLQVGVESGLETPVGSLWVLVGGTGEEGGHVDYGCCGFVEPGLVLVW